jgi:hypothetical protein
MNARFITALVGVMGLFIVAAPATAGDGNVQSACQNGCEGPYPDGYNGFMVFMATGSIPLTDSFFLDGAYFHEQIMNRSPAEIAQNRADALDFFASRFGLVDVDNDPDLVFFDFYVDPRIEYRAYVISGERVPPDGFEIHDGGWIAIVTNPDGITLGGAFAGRHVPEHTVFSFGDYSIERTRKGKGKQPDPLVIHYRCNHPLVSTFSGGEVFDCDLESDEFGPGIGQGVTTPLIENGVLRPNGRTVLTFSDDGGY